MNLERINILLVDDNRHMRLLLRQILRAFGCRNVYEATDGVEAIRILKSAPIDLILLDIAIPVLDGLETLKLIRHATDIPNKDIPIIMISGHTEKQNVMGAIEAGANDFIAKPVSAKAIYERVQNVLRKFGLLA